MTRISKNEANMKRRIAERLIITADFGEKYVICKQVEEFITSYDLITITGEQTAIYTAVQEISKISETIDRTASSSSHRNKTIWNQIKTQMDNLFPERFPKDIYSGRHSRLTGSEPRTTVNASLEDTRDLQKLILWLIANRILANRGEDAEFASTGRLEVLLRVMEKVDGTTSPSNVVDTQYHAEIEAALHALLQVPEDRYPLLCEKLGPERCLAFLHGSLDVRGVKAAIDEANAGLGTAVRQMLVEGADSLTRDELRKLKTFAANRLKDNDLDQQVMARAVAKDIYPLASELFPDRIVSPEQVTAENLTNLFRERSNDPKAKDQPLSDRELIAIKDLSQAWRTHFQHVVYRGDEVNVSLAGPDGLLFRKPGRGGKSRGTSKFWIKLEFKP